MRIECVDVLTVLSPSPTRAAGCRPGYYNDLATLLFNTPVHDPGNRNPQPLPADVTVFDPLIICATGLSRTKHHSVHLLSIETEESSTESSIVSVSVSVTPYPLSAQETAIRNLFSSNTQREYTAGTLVTFLARGEKSPFTLVLPLVFLVFAP